MSDPARNEHEAAGRKGKLVIAEQERRLPLSDVKRLIRIRVEMQGRAGFSGRNRQDFRDIRLAHLGRAKAKVAGAISGCDNGATVDRLHVERNLIVDAAIPAILSPEFCGSKAPRARGGGRNWPAREP